MISFYENTPKMIFFIEGIENTVGQMFEGLEDMTSEIKIADRFTENVPTVSVIKNEKSLEVPMFGAMFDMLGMIDIVVPTTFNDSWKFENSTVKMHGYGYTATGSNVGERKGFKVNSDMGLKSFVKKDVDFKEFDTDENGNRIANMAQIFAGENMEAFGECYIEISVVNVFSMNGDKKVRERTFSASISESAENSDAAAVKKAKGKIEINIVENMGEGTSLPDAGISIEPGNKLMFMGDSTFLTVADLEPAFYTIQAFADGFYPMKKTVALNSGEEISVGFFLDPIRTGTEKGTLSLSFNQTSDGGGTTSLTSSQPLDVILIDRNDSVFEKKEGVDATEGVTFLNVPYGQYTVKVMGLDFYPLLESVTVDYMTSFG
jgi:hypothetical protein